MENIGLIVMLLFGITFLGVLSNKYKFPFPIALVVSGVVISLVPGLPVITLQPDIVFLLFLPPLLYGAAWYTSWHEFRANIRPISLAAVGLVFFTTTLVAVAAHALIPGMSWPLGFLLGAIISPPDAVAATTVTRGLGLNPQLIAILEGESLVNDASGLIAYKYATVAVLAGNFVFWQAGLNFLLVVTGGVAIGLAIGAIMYFVHKRFICDPIIEVTLTLLTPFAAYLLAEHFHGSGVLAVVSSGLFLSFNSATILTHQSRIMSYAVWDVVVYVLNSLIFILIGLQLRSIMEGIKDYSKSELIFYGAVISAVVIVVRFVWVLPAALLPRLFSRRIRQTGSIDLRNSVVFGWAGMRGVVSMAAALSLPLLMPDGNPFPHRNLIIYLTFCVILSTLVLLGLTLPWVVRTLRIPAYSIAAEEYDARIKVVSDTIGYIEENMSQINGELLNNIKSKYEIKYERLQKTDLPAGYFGQTENQPVNIFNEFSQLQLDMIGVERQTLTRLHREGGASDEVLRKIERELDLEETRLRMEIYNG
ncbi:MAG: Na+/H+ antiporter [Puia sp.]|nr:Na+/H+ antiporter [Puia sp.]